MPDDTTHRRPSHDHLMAAAEALTAAVAVERAAGNPEVATALNDSVIVLFALATSTAFPDATRGQPAGPVEPVEPVATWLEYRRRLLDAEFVTHRARPDSVGRIVHPHGDSDRVRVVWDWPAGTGNAGAEGVDLTDLMPLEAETARQRLEGWQSR